MNARPRPTADPEKPRLDTGGDVRSSLTPFSLSKHEANIPSTSQKTRPQDRIPRPFGHQRRTQSPRQPSPRRPQASHRRLIPAQHPPRRNTLGTMRFRPRQHVRRQRDFREIREKGRRHDCGGFVLWYCRAAGAEVTSDKYQVTGTSAATIAAAAGTPLDTCHLPLNTSAAPAPARLGVVASSSAVGCAVRRARAKRRLREIFRRNQRLVPPGCDILLVARRAINQLEYSVMEQRFIDACRRIFKPSSDSQ